MEMLEAVKNALGITSTDPRIVAELEELIEAAKADLHNAGVNADMETDPLIRQAVKTYCRAHFRSPADYDRLLASYEAQKGTMMYSTGYTEWGCANGTR